MKPSYVLQVVFIQRRNLKNILRYLNCDIKDIYCVRR